MIHHVCINKDPNLEPNEEAQGHKFYFTRNFYVDYHPDNKEEVYLTVRHPPHPQVKFSDKVTKHRIAKFVVDLVLPLSVEITAMFIDGYIELGDFKVTIYPLNKRVLLLGTSASGKKQLCDTLKYKHLSLNEFVRSGECDGANVKNEYMNFDINSSCVDKYLDAAFDILHFSSPRIFPFFYNVMLYASLDQICKNIYESRLHYFVGLGVFGEYVDLFRKAKKGEEVLEVISLSSFITSLKQCKFLFTNEESLKSFAKSIFDKMEIGNKPCGITTYISYDLVLTQKLDKQSKALDSFIKSIL